MSERDVLSVLTYFEVLNRGIAFSDALQPVIQQSCQPLVELDTTDQDSTTWGRGIHPRHLWHCLTRTPQQLFEIVRRLWGVMTRKDH